MALKRASSRMGAILRRGGRGIAALIMTSAPAVEPPHHPDLGKPSDYHQVEAVWFGSILGQIDVEPETSVTVSAQGTFKWTVPDGAEVREGETVGLTNSEALELSRRELDLLRRRLPESLRQAEWATLEKRAGLRASIYELEERMARMSITDTELDLLGSAFAAKLAEEKTSLAEELEDLRDRMNGGHFEQLEAHEKETLELEVAKAEQAYRELERGSRVVAPVDGFVRYDVPEFVITKPVAVGAVLQRGVAEALVEIADPRVAQTDPERLFVEVLSDSGVTYRGRFARIPIKQPLQAGARALIFRLEGVAGEGVPRDLSGARLVRLMRDLERPGRAVPKNDILHRHTEAVASEGWKNFIETRWSGIRVVFIAPKVVIVEETPP